MSLAGHICRLEVGGLCHTGRDVGRSQVGGVQEPLLYKLA